MRILESLKDTLTSLKEISASDSSILNIYNLIISGQLQLIDHRFVGAADVSGQSVAKLVDTGTAKTIGINNLNLGKPAANQFMMVTGIKILALQAGGAITTDILRSGNWADVSVVAGLQNGVLNVKSDGKVVVNQLPMSSFLIGQRKDELGLYHLHFPKPILPDRDLTIEIDLGTKPLPANCAVKWELVGPTTSV